MLDLKIWEEKIKEKRKKTQFKNFVKEFASWEVLNLYKNKGQVCRYPDSGRVKNLDNKESQNASSYFLDYDFNLDFFKNFHKLNNIVPYQYLISFGDMNENTIFADAVFGAKDCYLSFVLGREVERILYSAFVVVNCKNIINSFLVTYGSENICMSAGITNSFNIFYSKYITDSANIWFSTNLIGCQECIFCNGLQNQRYCFQNKILEKEEYFKIKKQILEKKYKFLENYIFISKNEPINYLSENINGKFNIKCSNIKDGYWLNNMENVRNGIIGFSDGGDAKNFYDCVDFGITSQNMYGCVASGNECKNIYLSTQLDKSSNIYYSYFMTNCSFCIGCIGLKNKSYCILNKQYSKEEWYNLANKIFEQMDKDGILGDFFPGSLNPFYFNDTMAYLIDDSFTKEEVVNEGYMWRDSEIKVDIPEGADIVEAKDINNFQGYDSNGDWYINSEIMKKVIIDENGNYYKIVPMEYDFLMKHQLPLPEIHWLDRIKLGFKFK
nr:hypothetical protein [Candidatus Gracilibacteria bacterium]